MSETQPHNDQIRTSDTPSFLDSIPQWQPTYQQETRQESSKRPFEQISSQKTKSPLVTGLLPSQRPPQPVPAQRTRPPSARLQGLLPPSVLPRNLGPDERIPGIYRKDLLDGRIGIRPRNKKSIELQQLKRPRGETFIDLPRSMKIIIKQFMVANRYILSYQQTECQDTPAFRNSLLTRLDLHNTSKITKETSDEQRLLKLAWASVEGYVIQRSKQWQTNGVLKLVSATAQPTFAAFTSNWGLDSYNNSNSNLAYVAHIS